MSPSFLSLVIPHQLCLPSLCQNWKYRSVLFYVVLRNLVIAFLKQVLNIKNSILQEVGTKGTVDVLPSLGRNKLAVLCHGRYSFLETCASVLSGQHDRMSSSLRNTSKEAWGCNIEHWYAELNLSSTFYMDLKCYWDPHRMEVDLVSTWDVLLFWSVGVKPLLPLLLGARHRRKDLTESFLLAQLHKVQPNNIQHPFEWLRLENNSCISKRCSKWSNLDRVEVKWGAPFEKEWEFCKGNVAQVHVDL